ncbi:CheY-like chemotaxis protein [Povalibacter uvarum]|uniref:CheY-like chemotaxis protein n=1 Tax=Povalibacter uvarum TaxID=732238 RepID=A0A841HK13_9GAMM|nr:response regulator [Povalibacter uvarum]MBB6092578.1 CheY-like chemotaxis protein [Povalibacter uvarum]
MTTKRALIVDDSRSARVILSRMLEAYDLQVDAAESAEQALEYLRQNRPDVVFMDHLMPGMDGFQAIQAIKSNPDTATIPVMMYTSQEGELYVSQARALGAVGVLPKTVKPGDVSRVLYQLHLLPERREGRSNLFESEDNDAPRAPAPTPAPQPMPARTPAAALRTGSQPAVQVERETRTQVGEVETALRNAMAPALREYNAELRRYIAASMEVLTRKIASDKPAATDSATPVAAPERAPEPAPAPSRWPLLAAVAAVALIPTIVLSVLYLETLRSTRALTQSYTRLAAIAEEQQAQLTALAAARPTTAEFAQAVTTAITNAADRELVPYGETPLAGARLEHLRTLIEKLRTDGFKGKVVASSFAGEYCLTGNGIEGYSIAADDLPVKRCDLIGNPFDDSLTSAQRQSLPFANLVTSIPQQTGNALSVEVTHGGRTPAVPYPEGDTLTKTTAGEWNRIAAQNNRVEFVASAAQ